MNEMKKKENYDWHSEFYLQIGCTFIIKSVQKKHTQIQEINNSLQIVSSHSTRYRRREPRAR